MATTQAQRASLFNTLAELMGTEDAETLMEQLPPSGWDNIATKNDLIVLAATFTAALAETRVAFTDALSETNAAMQAGFAQAAVERAGLVKSQAELVRSQARNLYVTVSTIVLASISIWIALLAAPAGG